MPKIVIEDTGETYSCPPDRDILRGMELLGRKGIPVGCRGGGCGICKIQVLEGEVRTGKMSAEHIGEEDRGNRIFLACKVYPDTDLRIKVIGKMVRAFERYAPGRKTA